MSTSGDRKLPQPHWRLRLALIRRPDPKASREQRIEHLIGVLKQIASRGSRPTTSCCASRSRATSTAATTRARRSPLLAILASGSRVPILGQITAPTLVLHGADDPLIPVAAARDLHQRIRGSRMEILRRDGPRPAARAGPGADRADHRAHPARRGGAAGAGLGGVVTLSWTR